MSEQHISKDDHDAVTSKISDVIHSLRAMHSLATSVMDEHVEASTFAEVVNVMAQHNIRVLDACSERLGGVRHGNFEKVFE